MSLATVTLDDRYARPSGAMYLSGTQALVRLLLLQKWRDRAANLNTAGFVSGYRGSPLGGFDRELWRAQSFLTDNQIRFWPGINEDLAATAVWGSQMLGQHGEAAVDGVFGMWYGKGAGLDRCGDVMRHANGSGVHPRGGVLAVVGDDHAQKSSTHPYFSEPTFADLLMPVLYPSTIAEMMEYGLLGWAMSRYSGVWVGLKTTAELLDCSTSLDERLLTMRIIEPADGASAQRNVHFRWPDPWRETEIRWIEHRLPSIHAFARANAVDRVTLAAAQPRLGIVTAGKSYQDLLQALHDLGLSLEDCSSLGVSIYKVGMTWPLEPAGLRSFAASVAEILVIEEKRPVIEDQIRSALFDLPGRPTITGKKDAADNWQFPWVGELGPDRIARVLASKLGPGASSPRMQQRIAALDRQEAAARASRPKVARPPYFCSGCPHSTSTKLPTGSVAIAGVGCHYMAVDMDRDTTTFSHMGGEGATWIGQAPFSKTSHVFVNLGEGTYFHSGSLAVRACIAAGVNITYKLLYNDAVAMTGGQPVDGQLTVPQLAQQLHAEGIRGIRVVAENPHSYGSNAGFPPGTTLHPRAQLDAVQRELREVKGVTALIFDQTCAAEKRRRRKRRQSVDPARWAFINTAVCEGCGDCSVASNCLSVVPVDTELGRKRAIDQSSCNKDLSCVDGFCPSFVTVSAAGTKRPRAAVVPSEVRLPEPVFRLQADPYDIFITGVGGAGVVTIGALLGVAAHLEGKACSILDQLGMAQKGGAVVSHIRIGAEPAHMRSARVPTAGADLILGLDLAVALDDQAFSKIAPGRTQVILNSHETITGAFTRDPELTQPTAAMIAAVQQHAGAAHTEAFDLTALATALIGDSIASNLFALGYAFQKGLIPVSGEAIRKAIELNAVAVEANHSAFHWGRRAALDLTVVQRIVRPAAARPLADSLAGIVNHRSALLKDYQDAEYAQTYADFIRRVQAAESTRTPGQSQLSRAVARSLFKLMAYKDEYEVARLYTDGTFMKAVRDSFEGRIRLQFHLAPPVLGGVDPHTGRPRKRVFGPWILPVFRLLAPLRRLRGTRLDLFGYTRERRMERRLVTEYRAVVERVLAELTVRNHDLAVKIAELPMAMRGFGHVKAANVAVALEQQAVLLREFSAAELARAESPRDPITATLMRKS